jgi:hypothetical protein
MAFPNDAPNPNMRKVEPHLSSNTEKEQLSLSSAFAGCLNRAVQRYLRPGSVPEVPPYRHRYFLVASQAQQRRRRGRRRHRCTVVIQPRLRVHSRDRSRRIPSQVIDLLDAVMQISHVRDSLGAMRRSVVHHMLEGDALQLVARPSTRPSAARSCSRSHATRSRRWRCSSRSSRGTGTASPTAASWRSRTLRCHWTRTRIPFLVPSPQRPAETNKKNACEQVWKTSRTASAGRCRFCGYGGGKDEPRRSTSRRRRRPSSACTR